jgi:antirestriction protein ArdC
MTNTERQDVYTRITSQIISSLEQGVRPLDPTMECRVCGRADHQAAALQR